jgi:regulatory protein
MRNAFGSAMRKPRSADDKAKPKRPPSVTRVALEGAALRYLERFDCSVARLKKVLSERVAKAARAGVEGAAEGPAIIEQILQRYQESGLLNDQRFATGFAERQRDRGGSRRVIEQKLRARGVSSETVAQLLPRSASAASELSAAQAFARRRRLGPHRKPETREEYRRKDLMAMARAGFDYDTASRVIGVGNSRSTPDDEF